MYHIKKGDAYNKKASKINYLVAFSEKLFLFVTWTGFKPVTHSLEGCCSIQLSYRTF